MDETNESAEDEQLDPATPLKEQSIQAEELTEDAEELMRNPEPVLRKLRLAPDFISRAGEGFRALREGVSDFFVAGDRSAGRAKDTADEVVDLIQRELDHEGLSPQERLEFIQAGERMANQVGESEKDVRESNERTFTKIAKIAAGAAVSVILLGYLAKDDKLPLEPPTA